MLPPARYLLLSDPAVEKGRMMRLPATARVPYVGACLEDFRQLKEAMQRHAAYVFTTAWRRREKRLLLGLGSGRLDVGMAAA